MTINGISYIVVKTVEFSHNGDARKSVTLRRKNGKKTYNVVVYGNGAISSVV